MRTLRALLLRLGGLVWRARRERELAAELESHLQLHIDDNLRAGMSPDEARRAAILKFGPIERTKEEWRDRGTLPVVEALLQDVRYAARGLARRPGFTLLTVCTLAIGVGASAAMFGLLDALLLRPPPHVHDPDRIVRIDEISNYPRYADMKDRLHGLELAGLTQTRVSLGTGPGAVPLEAQCVTPNYFTVLGTRPVIGRAFEAADDVPGGEPVVVIAHTVWQRHFDADPGVAGSRVRIGGRDHTVVGVAPPRFRSLGLQTVDAWLLLTLSAEACATPPLHLRASGGWLITIGRITDGWTREQATAEIVAADTSPDTITTRRPDGTLETRPVTGPPRLRPIRDREFGSGAGQSVDRLSLWLGGGAMVLLLIACANVAGLLSMRAVDRRREIAIRLQLGAGRRRVFTFLLLENLLIALLCASAALLVAAWIGALLRAFFPVADLGELLHPRTVAVLGAFAGLAGILSGVVPAMQATRGDAAAHLRTGTVLHGRRRAAHALLVAQVALALVLIAGTTAFTESVRNFRLHLAYDLDHVVAASADLRRAGYRDAAEIAARYDLMLERVRQLPEVESAALTTANLLGERRGSVTGVVRQGHQPEDGGCCHALVAVSPDYFSTLGIRIVKGRAFTPADTATAQPTAIILDEDLARAVFPDADPIGQCVSIFFRPDCVMVTGISESARRGALRRLQLDSQFFVPFGPPGSSDVVPEMLVVRTRTPSRTAAATIASAIRHAAPDLPYVQVRPIADMADDEAQSWRLGASILGLFGGLAVALAAIGLYAALAFSVRQRTPEIGLRLALGADPSRIARMVLRDGLVILALGTMAGTAAALALSRYVEALLFEVVSGDVSIFLAAGLIIFAAGLAGCVLPALRASRVDPALALRAE
jgi:putative ABC transport system permease protein